MAEKGVKRCLILLASREMQTHTAMRYYSVPTKKSCRGCESWTRKAEHQTDTFESWGWRRLFRVPWMVRRSNQWMLKEINPEYSLEGLMLKLKLQYFGHLIRKADSLEKTLMLGKIEARRRSRQQRMIWLDSNTASMDMNLSKLQGIVKDTDRGMLQSMGSQRVRYN